MPNNLYSNPYDPELSEEVEDFLARYTRPNPDAQGGVYGLPDVGFHPLDVVEAAPAPPMPVVKTYRVHKGDAVENIARAHYGDNWRAGVAAIMMANGITRNQFGSPMIHIGQELVVPEFGEDAELGRLGGEVIAANQRGLDRLWAQVHREQEIRDAIVAHLYESASSATRSPGHVGVGGILAEGVDWLEHGPYSEITNSRLARQLAGMVGEGVGDVVGIAKGAVDTVKGAVDGAVFVGRLMNPLDLEARAQLADGAARAARGVWNYAGRAVRDPTIVKDDIARGVRHFVEDHYSGATPMADTLSGEFGRRERIGENNGRLVVDVGATLGGGALLKGANVAGLVERAALAAARRPGVQILSEATRTALQDAYEGMGSHFIPRRLWKEKDTPEWLKGPRGLIMDGPFNVLRPKGFTKEQQYILHGLVDPKAYGARLPQGLPERGWSRRRLGYEVLPAPQRLWYGSPQPFKNLIAAPLLTGEADVWLDHESQ